jgi:hypothetical protein
MFVRAASSRFRKWCRRWFAASRPERISPVQPVDLGHFRARRLRARHGGGKLFATFLAAGLPPPQMIAAARVEGGPHSQVYDYLAGTLQSLLPMAERTGVATATEIDIDGVAERLRREATASNACIMLPPLLGAWTRVPA